MLGGLEVKMLWVVTNGGNGTSIALGELTLSGGLLGVGGRGWMVEEGEAG